MALSRQELIDHEHALKDAVSEFLTFSSYSLFFPRTGEDPFEAGARAEPEFRKEDGELFLPLVLRGELLGYFVARGVRLAAPKVAPRYVMALASAALERIVLEKRVITDPLTGLSNREFFLSELTRSIEQVQDCLHTGACSAKPLNMELPSFSGTFGVIFIDLDNFRRVCERYGYLIGDDIVGEVGRMIRMVCPKHVTASRFANDKFAVLLPDAKPKACFQLAEVIRAGIAKLSFVDEITQDIIRISASVGYVNYPQAMEGPQFRREPAEQARVLLQKARRAVSTAKDLGRDRIFAFADILQKGGKVVEMLPMGRMAVSLGANVGARVGQRFLVSSPKSGGLATAQLTEDERLSGRYPTVYKGEAVLIEVQEEMAFAELLHVSDPSLSVSAGDRLRLVAEHESIFEPADEDGPRKDQENGIFAYRDFVAHVEKDRQSRERFGLTLVRMLDELGDQPGSFQSFMDSMARKLTGLARSLFGEETVAGRYGLGGLILYQPGISEQDLREKVLELEALASRQLDMEIAVGGAAYPYLNFRRTDMMDNCRKALEHAVLLPKPCVAVFDSVSLNLSADRHFTDGDIYGAVEEYKLSLLADEKNLLSRNSLGICYAQLGRLAEARKEFETVLAHDKTDAMALYNLGWANHRLGKFKEARTAYEKCLKHDPAHIFSMIRLGNLAERDEDLEAAEQWYSKAGEVPGGDRLVLRSLARVHLGRGDQQQCREYLHLALNANHNDDHAMHMLATMYLDMGEDPQVAEVLARQCAALRPDKDDYWETLVRSLLEQGKDEEAQKVRGRAS
ncbi:tetratricopeptide repeat-containing diguanylate cyclase [Salidesulfovibrio onnuriiensis]|uniref:tetratricopeptide repeat-containing diguanylate cyclase n=1 Tax=Salidesulfovibrio onnuriiensis TaxID=2583823 RepID=UPI002545FEE4|nr:diguanylate cyclase [Salidesulfovibrio onnuriiensis]